MIFSAAIDVIKAYLELRNDEVLRICDGTTIRPSGGIAVAYTPSIKQAIKFREAIAKNGFSLSETIEVLHRGWHIEGEAVRPDHRMVAHTGFISAGRLLYT